MCHYASLFIVITIVRYIVINHSCSQYMFYSVSIRSAHIHCAHYVLAHSCCALVIGWSSIARALAMSLHSMLEHSLLIVCVSYPRHSVPRPLVLTLAIAQQYIVRCTHIYCALFMSMSMSRHYVP
jgi:hypothetical protein